MEQIQNENFLVVVDRHGAEINHIYNRKEHFDYIWNNDIWPKHAPVLFPAIGRSNDDAYIYAGEEYSMPQHGFVSEYDFDVVKKTETELELSLSDNEETFKIYPFHFNLNISYILDEKGLTIRFVVNNTDEKALSFSLGSHPAFNLPIDSEGSFEDYSIEFSPEPSELKQFEIVKTPNPYRNGNVKDVPGFNGKLSLNYEIFEDGLIILKNEDFNEVKIVSQKSGHSIKLDISDFRYLTLWTKEGAEAPFLCLEPFNGLPDVSGDLRDIMKKEANILLSPSEEKKMSYKISLT